jgi:hypothetical protein
VPPPAPPTPPAPHVPAGFDLVIVASFPDLFAESRAQRFLLLWRGGCNGFRAIEFHKRCDGHPNTLTLINHTNNTVFDGFTPVEWQSRENNGKWESANNCFKADPSLKSFVFLLKNPPNFLRMRHNFLARKFALKAEEKHQAIYCFLSCGPHFDDIGISGHCNPNADSGNYLGLSYASDTGSYDFIVKEIEVFEITD